MAESTTQMAIRRHQWWGWSRCVVGSGAAGVGAAPAACASLMPTFMKPPM